MADPAQQTLSFSFNRVGVPGSVEVNVGVNDDPASLGCPDWAHGFPWCRATIDHPARGYSEALGWVQLVDWDLFGDERGFLIDPFAPLGDVSHPFSWFGYAPTLFDAPHTEDGPIGSEFIAHSFLCGLGHEPLEQPLEVDAVLGFEWGFRIEAGGIRISALRPLGPEAWDEHRQYLARTHPDWIFLSGFAA